MKELKNKVLFLDIDGVVNCCNTRQSHRGFIGIDPLMAFIVGKLVMNTDVDVVLSSSWRHWEDGREEVRKQVVEYVDMTPDDPEGGHRGREIKMWLDRHPEVTKYAILDDDTDMLEEQLPFFFQTRWSTGITEEIAKQVEDFFNKE